ncbi:HAD-IA family hydrolase [Actinacidiphila glaucinigra]|uniref:HAD-IA family hydrolase n=1 Tax=Actinacidiphila glaucinigra TaxID=235986 RepID=UPI002E2FEB7A|nr:HAD-IA family hydrolase [Actinacidiphila glaucinigra]
MPAVRGGQGTAAPYGRGARHRFPDPAAYRWCRDALREDPARILFVDDRPENIRAAQAAGMRGHLFTGPARLRERLSRF